MSLPTFVIAGAQKCGTTTLHRMVRRHPQVFMSTPKEVHFFDHNWDKGLDWYSAHFRPRPRQVHAGESTPTYMYDAESRERMIKTLPDALVVLILRDPTKRAYSHYWHSRRKNMEQRPTFEEALEREEKRVASDSKRRRARYSYVHRGQYIDQIEALESAYGRDRMHVILLDDLVGDHVGTLRSLFEFLGIRTKPAARIQAKQANPGRPAAGAPPFTAGPAIGATEPAGGDIDDEEDDDDTAEDATEDSQPSVGYPPMTPATRELLLAHYRPYNDRLAAWLGRDLSHWE